MSNFLLGYDNQLGNASYDGTYGSWNAGFPLSNLSDYRLSLTARSTNALAASTKLRFSVASSPEIAMVSLIGTNVSPDATVQWRTYSNTSFTTLVFDSGVLPVFPSGSMPNAQITAGAPNAGTGKPTLAEIKRFQRNIHLVLAAPTYAAPNIAVDIVDTANTDGYLEVSRIFVGRAFQPRVNPEYGNASLVLTSGTKVSQAQDGTPYFIQRRPSFSIPFGLSVLNEDEAMRMLDVKALLDVYGEGIVMWDPTTVAYWWRKQAFGRLKQIDPIQHPVIATYSTTFQIDGVI